jgi:hypothetical protein
MEGQGMNLLSDINLLALIKGEERYFLLYDDEHKSDCLRTLGRWASNQDLSFSWHNAAVLSQKVRETAIAVREGNECNGS